MPGTEPGDPGPLAPESIAQQRRDPFPLNTPSNLAWLTAEACKAAIYREAALNMLRAHNAASAHVKNALAFLDMLPRDGMSAEQLSEHFATIERALRPEPIRQAAE